MSVAVPLRGWNTQCQPLQGRVSAVRIFSTKKEKNYKFWKDGPAYVKIGDLRHQLNLSTKELRVYSLDVLFRFWQNYSHYGLFNILFKSLPNSEVLSSKHQFQLSGGKYLKRKIEVKRVTRGRQCIKRSRAFVEGHHCTKDIYDIFAPWIRLATFLFINEHYIFYFFSRIKYEKTKCHVMIEKSKVRRTEAVETKGMAYPREKDMQGANG